VTVFAVEPLPGLWGDLGGEGTLDELIARAWEDLAAHHSTECPVCGGELRAVFAAHPLPIGGRCDSCGSKLA
jgi:hypothetical protein